MSVQSKGSAFIKRGDAFMGRGLSHDGVINYKMAAAIEPCSFEPQIRLAFSYYCLGNFLSALAHCKRAIEICPANASAHKKRGDIYRELKKPCEALACYEKAIELDPNYTECLIHYGALLSTLGMPVGALASYDRAIHLAPNSDDAWLHRGYALYDLQLFEKAFSSFEKALSLRRNRGFALGDIYHARLEVCDWSKFEKETSWLISKVEKGKQAFEPFTTLAVSNSPVTQLKAAKLWAASQFRMRSARLPPSGYRRHDKIRLGYFSSDFGEHPVSYLCLELFEIHCRTRFDISAFSLAKAEGGMTFERLKRAFGSFNDVSELTDAEVVELAREQEIDIAIDLGGYTGSCRTAIFYNRAAPIQVSYLGYPGTMGAAFIDYIIADEVLIPRRHREAYTESVVYLPSFQVNDTQREISQRLVARCEAGLPSDSFVFCCLNASYKLNPRVFDCWARILMVVDNSVLWLQATNDLVKENLRKEAEKRGVNPKRLVFSKRLSRQEYLARYRLADLFLDTFPYNAGATASDALWMGLPVLTYIGDTFAGRMGASLLTAINLPELIADSLSAYHDKAVELATNPAALADIRDRLAFNRATARLFDTRSFAGNLEFAFEAMYERYRTGSKPNDIVVKL